MKSYEKQILELREILSDAQRSEEREEALALLTMLEAKLGALTEPKPVAPSSPTLSVKTSCPKCGCALTISHP